MKRLKAIVWSTTTQRILFLLSAGMALGVSTIETSLIAEFYFGAVFGSCLAFSFLGPLTVKLQRRLASVAPFLHVIEEGMAKADEHGSCKITIEIERPTMH